MRRCCKFPPVHPAASCQNSGVDSSLSSNERIFGELMCRCYRTCVSVAEGWLLVYSLLWLLLLATSKQITIRRNKTLNKNKGPYWPGMRLGSRLTQYQEPHVSLSFPQTPSSVWAPFLERASPCRGQTSDPPHSIQT